MKKLIAVLAVTVAIGMTVALAHPFDKIKCPLDDCECWNTGQKKIIGWKTFEIFQCPCDPDHRWLVPKK